MKWNSEYFYGTKISKYGLENGYVDYRTLASAFDAVLNNEIMGKTWGVCGEWEQVSGWVDHSEEIEEKENEIEELTERLDNIEGLDDNPVYIAEVEELREKIDELRAEIEELEDADEYQPEVFQYYIVDDNGARILEEAEEVLFYNNDLDMYIWGVTHYGTAWDYVLTDIKIELEAA